MSSDLEFIIQKGSGQYATTVGFADVLAFPKIATRPALCAMRDFDRGKELLAVLDGKRIGTQWRDTVVFSHGDPHPLVAKRPCHIGVEVKIAPVPASEILRQIKFYQEYVTVQAWVAATDFGLDGPGAELLRSQGVRHVRLGRAFDAWVSAQQRVQSVESPVI